MSFDWATVIGAVASSMEAQQRMQAEQYRMQREAYVPPAPILRPVANCPCCGARQFVYRDFRRICAYCGSDQ